MTLTDLIVRTYNSMIVGGANVFSYIGVNIMAPMVVSLYFLLSFYYILQARKEGIERAKLALKDRAFRAVGVFFVCVPLATVTAPSGDSYPVNAMTLYPWLIVQGAAVFADDVANHLPVFDPDKKAEVEGFTPEEEAFINNCREATEEEIEKLAQSTEFLDMTGYFKKNDGGLLEIPRNATYIVKAVNHRMETLMQCVKQWKEEHIKEELGLMEKVKLLVNKIALFLILLVPIILLAAISLATSGVTTGILLFVNSLALFLTKAAVLTAVKILMVFLVVYLVKQLLSLVFYVFLTFAFFGVLVSWAFKMLIYMVTYPISSLNLCFDSRREAFWRYTFKGVAMLLVPTLAGVLFSLSLLYFAYLSAPGGLIETFYNVFVGPYEGFSISWVLKSLLFALISPFALVLPVVRVMNAIPTIVEEMIMVRAGYGVGSFAERIGG